MAWMKPVLSEKTGEIYTYWEVVHFSHNNISKLVVLSYHGYKTLEDMKLGKKPMTDSFSFFSDESPDLYQSLINYSQAKIKVQPLFRGSVKLEE